MRNPLFSTYRSGENRVTSSLMAVLQRLEPHLVERILGGAVGEATLALLTYTNQPSAGNNARSVPDASISASFKWLFEVKTDGNTLSVKQLESHLAFLDGTHADERLFVLTPDPEQPLVINALADPKVVWLSFVALSQSIDSVLADPAELVGEHAVFLLRELQALFVLDGLLDHDDVLVVAAREAYAEYLEHGAYVCQPNRSFRAGLTHLGFYTDKAIRPKIAAILHCEEAVAFTREEAQRRAGAADPYLARTGRLIHALLDAETRTEGIEYKVFLLSRFDDPLTHTLPQPVANTKTSATGKSTAWTQSHRYTRLTALSTHPATTTELDALG